MKFLRSIILSLILSLSLFLSSCSSNPSTPTINKTTQTFNINSIPEYNGEPYTVINANIPFFSESDLTTKSFEKYSYLDSLGRIGIAFANIGKDIMPTEERKNIYHIKPTGWHSVKYDIVDGESLYNRCHLIGFQLSAENANEKNLMTGTRYLNTQGMLPFENMVADYVKETNNHVLYRITPIFEGDNIVANGVLMEAKSVEDNGKGILFNVFVYNVQPGIDIDYKTGESSLTKTSSKNNSTTYVLNTNTKVFHYDFCSSLLNTKNSNKQNFNADRTILISQRYSPCQICKP